MKRITIVMLLLLPGGLFSCGNRSVEKQAGEYYFDGLLHWKEETPYLNDGATGAVFPVVGLQENPAVQRFLFCSGREEPAQVYVSLMGHFTEDDPAGRILQIDSLLHIAGSKERLRTEMVSGFYVAEQAGERSTLLLNGSYGFRQNRFAGETEESRSGKWQRISRNEVVLLYSEKNGSAFAEEKILRFDPDTGRLTDDNAKKQTIYRKEYL